MPRNCTPIVRPDAETVSRFWAKVRKSSEPDGCWEWQAALDRDGYGGFRSDGRFRKSHRVAYAIEHGATPSEFQVLHRCDNPSCVRPSHLFLGSQLDNMNDALRKGRHGTQQPGYLMPQDRYPERVPNGEQHCKTKFTKEQVLDIFARCATQSQTSLALEYHVSVKTIWGIASGRTWYHVTGMKRRKDVVR